MYIYSVLPQISSEILERMKNFYGILKINIWNIWDTYTYTHIFTYAIYSAIPLTGTRRE